MILTMLAAITLQAAEAPPRDPRNWPAPVMDTVPPQLPKFKRKAVLILSKTNGFRDPEQIEASKKVLVRLTERGGREVFETENAAVMNPRDLNKFSTVVLNSTSGDIFDPLQREAFRKWVERGGGVVLLHGAGGDPKYDWDWHWQTLLGAQFIGHTGRPKQFQEAVIDIVAPDHPVVRGLPKRWTRTDEWYSFDRIRRAAARASWRCSTRKVTSRSPSARRWAANIRSSGNAASAAGGWCFQRWATRRRAMPSRCTRR